MEVNPAIWTVGVCGAEVVGSTPTSSTKRGFVMTAAFILTILYFIVAITLVLVFVAGGGGAEDEIDRQEIEE